MPPEGSRNITASVGEDLGVHANRPILKDVLDPKGVRIGKELDQFRVQSPLQSDGGPIPFHLEVGPVRESQQAAVDGKIVVIPLDPGMSAKWIGTESVCKRIEQRNASGLCV